MILRKAYPAGCQDFADNSKVIMFPFPPVRQINNLSWLHNGAQCPECLGQDDLLLGGFERFTKGMAERPSKEDSSRWFHAGRILSHDG
jgi:hypothetical protein